MSMTAEKELEYGVKYAEYAVSADMQYIYSDKYAVKFAGITSNEKVNKTILECSRSAIAHRTGTLYEDMYLINGFTGKVEGFQIESRSIRKIEYNDSLRNAIARAAAYNVPLIALHTHPEGYPPSVDDFNSLFCHGYALGIVAGHNGQVYTFRGAGKMIKNADIVQCNIALAYSGGADVDRAYREAYNMLGIDYRIEGGFDYEQK